MEKIKLHTNGQWELEKSYYPARVKKRLLDAGKDTDMRSHADPVHMQRVVPDVPFNYEKHVSTTPVIGKNGEKLFHHIYQSEYGDDDSRDVRHVLSRSEDPSKPGVAGQLVEQRKNGTYDTAEGAKHLGPHAVSHGIRLINEDENGKNGYGSQLFHNVIHHHGTLVGDYSYSEDGEKLSDHMTKQNKYYKYTPDKEEETAAKAKTGGTRRIFELKDKSKQGLIPSTHLSYLTPPKPSNKKQ